MSLSTERTRLLPNVNRPQYLFDASISRERTKRLKQFQCCLCAIFLSILLIALIVTVAYSINNSDSPPDNSTSSETDVLLATVVLFTKSWPISDFMYKNQTVNDKMKWAECIEAGETALKEKDDIEKDAPSLPLQSPSYRHQKVVATSEKARNLARIGYIEEFAARHMLRNQKKKGVLKRLCNNDDTMISKFCETKWRECNIYHKYRSYNGTCNNLRYPEFYGVSYTPFRRALPPAYADGM